MDCVEDILSHACAVLSQNKALENVEISHVVDRYFSKIYEINGEHEKVECKYIVKISTTDRSCRNEYEQYQMLKSKHIRSLTPIYHSEKYNYLITQKESLIEFDRYLKIKSDHNYAKNMFFKLGVLFKNIDNSTGHNGVFITSAIKDYIFSRLNALSAFSVSEKKDISQKIENIVNSLEGVPTRNCLVSDFTLGNIHVDDDEEFVLVDMGDASTGNAYNNIAYLYLNIKFGSLNQYMENPKTTQEYFSNFLTGYDLQSINNRMFNLYKIKHLLLMISFVSNYKTASKSIIRVALSGSSNKYLVYRYKRELYKLLGEFQ